MKTPDHMFHGYATGFGARVEKPFWHQVSEASTALSPVGGRATAVSRNFQLGDLFEFEEARSSVLGHFYLRTKGEDSFTAETRVSSSVEGLVIPGVLRVDRVGMTLVSERDFPKGERRFRVEEARIEGLQVHGQAVANFDASRDAAAALKRLCQGATEAELGPELKKPIAAGVYWSPVHKEGDCGPVDVRKPAFTVVKGDTTYDIFLVELLMRSGSVDLNMLRVDISSNPGGGGGAGGSGGVNGSPST